MTALWSLGFRPFFLGGALFAAVELPYWLLVFVGHAPSPGIWAPVAWHAHEMLYGYLAAVVAGFLLTAMPNWLASPPLRGVPLVVLFALWLAGRVAIAAGRELDATLVAAIDCAFLFALAAVLALAVARAGKWPHLAPVAVVLVLAGGNVVFHATQASPAAGNPGIVVGLGVAVVLIALIGGRVIPAFTRNWLVGHNPGRMPVPFNGYDRAAVALGIAALLAWGVAPHAPATAIVLALAGVAHAWRLARWAGYRATREPLLAVLHVGYGFVPLGFLLLAIASRSDAVGESAAIHAWTAGAIGVMTLAMMSRVTLGHTGNPLVADGVTRMIFAAIVLAAVLRIVAGLQGVATLALLVAAGVAWTVAMAAFIVRYGPLLLRPRL